jgi:hypothetical protein
VIGIDGTTRRSKDMRSEKVDLTNVVLGDRRTVVGLERSMMSARSGIALQTLNFTQKSHASQLVVNSSQRPVLLKENCPSRNEA